MTKNAWYSIDHWRARLESCTCDEGGHFKHVVKLIYVDIKEIASLANIYVSARHFEQN